MTTQYSLTSRTNRLTQLNTDIGINAVIKLFSGSAPANCGTADSGTLGVTFAGNATQFGTVASQVLTASAVANATAAATITAGYYRIYPAAATTTNAVTQGTCFQTTALVTNALTAANSNVLNFASTTGVVVGMTATGTGYPAGATVISLTSTSVTLSAVSTAGVASGATITFGGDMNLTNTSIASGQTCTFGSLTITAFGV